MPRTIVPLAKRFATVVTLSRLVPSMSLLMLAEVCLLVKGLPTPLTLVGFHSAVTLLMGHEG